MSVESSCVNGSKLYDWDSAGFTWDNATMGNKNWDNMFNSKLSLLIKNDLNISCGKSNKSRKYIKTNINISSQQNKKSTKKININLNIKSEFNSLKRFYRTFVETFTLVSLIKKANSKTFIDGVNITGFLNKCFEKKETELITVTKENINTCKFFREFEESLLVIEKKSNSVSKTFVESLQVVEAYLRNINAVMSDLYFSEGSLTFENFKKMTMPVGYSDFRDFVIGDYEYQQAIFRTMIEGAITTDRPVIEEWSVNVDLPDTTDRGTVVVGIDGIRVEFKKRFYCVPEMSFIIRNNLDADIKYTVDDKGFTIQLVKDLENVKGTVSWSANGY